MNTCQTCGGDADRGWTDGEAHTQCVYCACGLRSTPRPDINRKTYWQLYYARRKARQWENARHGR